MDLLGTGYETQLRRGLEAACRRHDLNLLLVFGRGVEDATTIGEGHGAVYESITAASVDGVILGSGLVSLGCADKVAAWVARRPSLPPPTAE